MIVLRVLACRSRQFGLEFLPGLRVQGGERLVHQQDFRLDGEGAR